MKAGFMTTGSIGSGAMKQIAAAAALICAALFTAPAAAQTRSFDAASMAAIEAEHAGKPFLLVLWSADGCAYCAKELVMLGELVKRRPDLPLVFVSTDSPEWAPEMEAMLAKQGLSNYPSWVFDDAIPERPRRAVDPKWHGDVPRTYLYDAAHARETVRGLLDPERLNAWIAQHLK